LLFKKKKTAEAGQPMDLDAVMKKFDRESNTRVWEGTPKIIVNSILALFSLFCIYVTFFATWPQEIVLSSFVGSIVFAGYLLYPIKKGAQKVNYMPWYDIILMVIGSGSFFYYTFDAMTIITQGRNFLPHQIVIGIIGILCLFELCRRCVGLPILIVATAFIIYAIGWGLTNPDIIRRIETLFSQLFYSTTAGILSTPINTCSKFIAIFIIFGAFLERTGIADFFIKISNSVVGGFSGGPAKVAVVASAMEGMVSGSSVANTVGSGSVTIPLMKKTGYKPEFAAAAARAVASGECDKGIVLCTTGIGVSITANKIKGIRCALLSDVMSARLTREHNDTNMMALGAGVVGQLLALQIVDTWLETDFSGDERHQRRIDKLMACEE
jgi:RpiB/LacA/LacB family sugar-phosphate isomerase